MAQGLRGRFELSFVLPIELKVRVLRSRNWFASLWGMMEDLSAYLEQYTVQISGWSQR